MAKTDNIVFIGYLNPKVKSQVAKLFSEKASLKYFNSTDSITTKKNLTSQQMIDRWGIEELINLEFKSIKRFKRKKGYLICTSHNLIFSEKGLELLHKNGTIIYLSDSLNNFLDYQKTTEVKFTEAEASKRFKDLDFLCQNKADISVTLKWRKGELQAGETIKEILEEYLLFNKLK